MQGQDDASAAAGDAPALLACRSAEARTGADVAVTEALRPMPDPLELIGISKTYPGVVALDRSSLAVAPRRGASGSSARTAPASRR